MALVAKDKLTVVTLLVIVGVDLEAIDRDRILFLVQATLAVTGSALVVADIRHLKVEAELAELLAVAEVGVGGPDSIRVARGLLGNETLRIKLCVSFGMGQLEGWVGGRETAYSVDEEAGLLVGLGVDGTGSGKGGKLQGSADESRDLHGGG